MEIRRLSVPEVVEFRPVHHRDDRGEFLEWFRADEFEAATGRRWDLRQANLSVSLAGVARGIHFSDVPPGQAKYVTAVHGAVTDYAVDLRVGSPTFGDWDAVELDDVERNAVFLPEGFGHAFVARSASAIVAYLTTDIYRPQTDRSLSLRDPDLALPIAADAILSPKDETAPTLAELRDAGLLPDWQSCLALYAELAVDPSTGD